LPEHPVAVGLGAVRGLGQQGLDVAAVCPRSETGILRSRYVKQGFVIPTGNGYMDRLEAFLLETFRSGGVLVATSDESAEFLQYRRAVLHEHGFRFLIPHDDTTELLNDKRPAIEFIRSLEIPLPRSVSRIHRSGFLRELRPSTIKGALSLLGTRKGVSSEPFGVTNSSPTRANAPMRTHISPCSAERMIDSWRPTDRLPRIS
jgi:hypothetical protein